MTDAKWFRFFQVNKTLQKYAKNAVPNDLVDKLCVNNKPMSLKSSKILAVRSTGLHRCTIEPSKSIQD